ncbi:hypothetical protein O3M35_008283 [Rhynocoris fuscipes]|uniref:RNase H type-1 domain-containing protein n=1 Tax=Rhynocoris fuscipes TaxID=488301 RepID=A0AAW1D767_9HEMI
MVAVKLTDRVIVNKLLLDRPSSSSSSLASSIDKIVAEILGILGLLSEKAIQVNFVWVRGHCGIKGNEVVDGLAKETALEGEGASIKIPSSDIKHNFTRSALAK